jgi:hypothetical protein
VSGWRCVVCGPTGDADPGVHLGSQSHLDMLQLRSELRAQVHEPATPDDIPPWHPYDGCSACRRGNALTWRKRNLDES